jgi:hypothetical protein
MDEVLDLRAEARAAAAAALGAALDGGELQAPAIATWRGRMVNEHGSSRVFDALAGQLERAGFDAETVATCRAFAAEERRHGVLCGAVVEALGGEARAPALPRVTLPEHEDAGDVALAALRNLISVSCLSETVAVALIGAEREEMPDGPLRELLTQIWSDEVGHARFGWRVVEARVPSLGEDARAGLGRYLAVAFAHLEAHELSHLPANACTPEGGPALGLCSGAEARDLFYATVLEVIVPGLERVGLPARAAWDSRR